MLDREFIIRLRFPPVAENDPRANIRKLRTILKRFGRTYGIHCVECRPAEQQPPPSKE